ncbi:hypothetical protein [Paenibacillus sp. CF384]|uniref:hypothetical protein n=1 Tax=Paenibacillus sp. CF384 TaxID=1884382 RepID=UPI0008959D4D|nr:hypothetical protein [Paenibacillus sp. CF384]SDX28203.1 hypothetical protein SAMN05518855_1011144 [Paenibacillus sp. CF384]
MIPVLLWIFGCYALAAAAVHAVSALTWRRERHIKHYVLIAGNEQLQMEWYMRSLRRFSHFTGTEVKVTVVDRGSEDETMSIARCFAKHGMNVHFHSSASPDEHGRLPETLSRPASVKAHEVTSMKDGKQLSGKSEKQLTGHSDKHLNVKHERIARAKSEQNPSVKSEKNSSAKSEQNSSAKSEQNPSAKSEKNSSAKNEESFAKWHRFRTKLRISGRRRTDSRVKKQSKLEPTNLLWMLQAEGVVSVKDHAVLIDLRDPADLSKLPF